MSMDTHSVSKSQWAKLGVGGILVLLLLSAIVLGGALSKQGASPASGNPSLSLLEQTAGSNLYSYTIFTQGSSIYVTNYLSGNITELLTSNPMDAAGVINNILGELGSLPTASSQIHIVQLKGTFTIDKSILVPSWCILDLRSASLTLANTTDKDMITNTQQLLGNEMIGIIGGVLDGNQAGQTGGARAEPASAIIHFWNSHELLVEDAQLKNAKWENLLFSICYNVVVKNVDSQGAGYQGIATEFGSHDVLITNCTTHNNEVDGILIAWNNITVIFGTTLHLPDGYNTVVSNCDSYDNAVFGISIEGYTSTRNVTVTNSTIYGNGYAGLHIGTGSDLLVTNSDIYDNTLGFNVTTGGQNPVATAPVDGLTISDSTISNNANGGIYLLGISSSDKIQNVLITHDTLFNSFFNVSATYADYQVT
jgi:hypothetical protein